MSMKIGAAFDHPGTGLREPVVAGLVAQGHEVLDLGGSGGGAADAAVEISDAILAGRCERGILVSTSPLAASFFANKLAGIHAGVCTDTYDARRGGENGVNLMCLGSHLTASEAVAIVAAFIGARTNAARPAAEPPARAFVAA
jgi:ribose 5-phosphate isomerase B